MEECPACFDTLEVNLPVSYGDFFGVETYDCPCCKPWAQGFGGAGYTIDGKDFWVIHPALPNQPAKHYTQK